MTWHIGKYGLVPFMNARFHQDRNMARGRQHASAWCKDQSINSIEEELERLDATLVDSCRDNYDRGYMDVLRERIWGDRT